MCGIAGWIVRKSIGLPDATVKAMTDSLVHRGPDGEGLYFADASADWRVGLGHRRLSIIDLAGGAQPMTSADGTTVAFNGEIYNYRELRTELQSLGAVFRTQSDTEVLLHGYRHWGVGFINRLAGMFAFALWEPRTNRLVVVRDRFGKKPLFLYRRDGLVAFASEIKAILTLPGVQRELDHDALGLYFAFRYVPGPRTMFRGVSKLAPGHALVWEEGRESVWPYYIPPDSEPRLTARPHRQPVQEFERLLDQAVTRRLVADVPLGAFLSGGLDSSTIVGLMARNMEAPVETYAIGFSEARYSELPYAELVARHFGCNHHSLIYSTDQMIDGLAAATRFRDAPLSEPADLPLLLLSRTATESLKVVLSGEGADEFLGGYPKHAFERGASLYQALVPDGLHQAVIEPLLRALPYGLQRVKTAGASLGQREFIERMSRWFGVVSSGGQEALTTIPRTKYALANDNPGNSALRRILFFDQSVWLPDNLLERGDRMTMAASLESRMPFMDHDLIAFVSSLPDNYRLRGMTGKWILRRVAETILPQSIIRRPKSGFRMPLNEWFRREMRPFLTDTLDAAALSRPFYLPGRIESTLNAHIKGRENNEKLIWQMLSLELFMREYRPSV